jgi:hypothetical protein
MTHGVYSISLGENDGANDVQNNKTIEKDQPQEQKE